MRNLLISLLMAELIGLGRSIYEEEGLGRVFLMGKDANMTFL